jgi:hypothetical protein
VIQFSSCKPRRNGRGWRAHCPAHDDRTPSLSVSVGNSGQALLCCHAGCKTEHVLERLGLTWADLSPAQAPSVRTSATSRPRIWPTPQAAAEAVARTRGGSIESLHRWTPTWYRARIRTPAGKSFAEVTHTTAGWVLRGPPKPHPLYRVNELPPTGEVLVVEGERCADSAWSIGLPATTSGSASSAQHADWSPLRGRDVTILPDADDPGRQYAREVGKILHGLGCRIRILDLHPERSDGLDLVDYLREQLGSIEAEQARAILLDRIAAAPLFDPAPTPYTPFPVDALPDVVRVFVESVAAATGTDAAYGALAALVVLAGCVGNRAAAVVKRGWTEPAALWAALIGRSGTTKSPVLALTTRALIDLFRAERRAFVAAQKEYLCEIKKYKVLLDEWKRSQRKRSGPPTDPPIEPKPPIERRVLVSDCTVEGLAVLLEQNPLGLLLVRDELAGWITGFDRYTSGRKGGDQPAWLSMYAAAPLVIDRKVSASCFVARAAVSLLGTIQPGTLARVFGRAAREAGLLARLIIANPPERPALWTEADLPDAAEAQWRDLLAALLALPADIDEHGNSRPRYIPIGREAKPMWVAWHDDHVREMVDIKDDDLVAHFSKLKGVCVRIALLFECVQAVLRGSTPACIGADAMRRAVVVVEWLKREGRRVYSMLAEREQDRVNRHLIGWIARQGGSVTARELAHGLRQYRGRPDAARADLNALAAAGCGAWERPTPGPKGGRPSPRFVLTSADTPDGPARTGGDASNGRVGDDEDWGEV